MTWIQTYTGRHFDPLNPDPAQLDEVDIAHALSYVARFGGHTLHHYSVGQHSLLVCDLVEDPADKLQALLHDATEAYIGDMLRPLKQVIPEFRRIEQGVWEAICMRFGIAVEMAPAIHRADMVALATERRDLLSPDSTEWACLRGIEPVPTRIRCMDPTAVRFAFLTRLMELMP